MSKTRTMHYHYDRTRAHTASIGLGGGPGAHRRATEMRGPDFPSDSVLCAGMPWVLSLFHTSLK